MSWRSGSKLFVEVWPLIQTHVSNKKQRQEFVASLLRVFLEWDIDPYDVADVHPDVAKALQAIGVVVETGDDGDDVAICASA